MCKTMSDQRCFDVMRNVVSMLIQCQFAIIFCHDNL